MSNPRYIPGHWMGSIFSTRGKRWDWDLVLELDGAYVRRETDSTGADQTEKGKWTYEPEHKRISFAPDGADCKASFWSVLDVTTCEDANTLLVLRARIFASRNLPILLYRVHLEGEKL